MVFLEIAFLGSFVIILYIYLGYPILVSLIGSIINRRVLKGHFQPYVTILIPAHNEENFIGATLENKLALDYPKEKVEIILISDCSTDRTDEIARNFAPYGVKNLRQEPRSGKTAALNLAVPKAQGEIVIFSDANSIYREDALQKLVQNFSDPSVGYVTGKMVYTDPDGTMVGDGCTAYMKYENFLRKFETRIGSVVGVDGGIDAVRKSLYQPMNPDQLPDFVLPLKVVRQGYRVVYEPEAILREASLKDSKDEYRMRVRVSLRALWALWDMRELLSIRKFRLFAWQLWSHKVLRYLCFFLLMCAYILNLALWQVGDVYRLFFTAQSFTYLLAVFYPVLGRMWAKVRGFYFLNYFLLLNLAAGHAFFKFLLRQKQVIWTPRKG